MRSKHLRLRAARQHGATLFVALIMLVLIMMIGLVAVTSSSTQFKLAGNLQFEDVAMNNAETAVATAERWLSTGTNYLDAGFQTSDVAKPELHSALAGSTNTPPADLTTYAWDGSADTQVSGVTQRYLIVLVSTGNRLIGSSAAVGRQASAACNQVNTYMITGRGSAPRGAVKLVQSYFSVLAC